MPFPQCFATERLRAERLTPEHLPELRRMHGDPDFMAMLGGVRVEAETVAYLARNLQHWTDHGFGIWVLHENQQNRVAGLGLLRRLLLDGSDEVEVGYGFHPEFWGRGLATEIAAACLQFGHEQLRLPSIVALTLPDNLRSQRVLIKVGLVYERDVSDDGVPSVLFRSRP
jgi:RimJ/RimL family protein N-acetyltransferase